MNIVLLSGGSGKRLWPLSNEVRSKQFLKVFKTPEGNHESMVQRIYRMVKEVSPSSTITVATSEDQICSVRSQLGSSVDMSIEPCRKDTFPAIALSVSYLHDVKKLSSDEVVVVCPVDPNVEIDYFQKLEEVSAQAGREEANLVLMGIKPTYPSEKYGYIIPQSNEEICFVKTFKEKPNTCLAEEYIKEGALWNSGIFAFKVGYLLEKAQSVLGFSSYKDLLTNYSKLEKISFDYAVVEEESKIQVVRFNGSWKDIGTWNSFTEAMSEKVSGNAKIDFCENTHVINELQIPLIAIGINNAAIVATPDGILVTDKDKSDLLKNYVTSTRPMYERRLWGEYRILGYCGISKEIKSLTKHLVIEKGKSISYQIHRHRSEQWTIIDGKGIVVIDGEERRVKQGDYVQINPGVKHAIYAISKLQVIEVQIGEELTESDIERLSYDFNKEGI